MQNLNPDVWQVVFAYVPIQGWIVDGLGWFSLGSGPLSPLC